MQKGWWMVSRLMLESPEGKGLVGHEILPGGYEQLAAEAKGEDIDEELRSVEQ